MSERSAENDGTGPIRFKPETLRFEGNRCDPPEPISERVIREVEENASPARNALDRSLVGYFIPIDQWRALRSLLRTSAEVQCPTCAHPEGYDRLSGPCPTCHGDGAIPTGQPTPTADEGTGR